MTGSIFALGLLIVGFGFISILDSEIGIFPFAFPHFEDTISIIAIGAALVTLGLIFRTPTES